MYPHREVVVVLPLETVYEWLPTSTNRGRVPRRRSYAVRSPPVEKIVPGSAGSAGPGRIHADVAGEAREAQPAVHLRGVLAAHDEEQRDHAADSDHDREEEQDAEDQRPRSEVRREQGEHREDADTERAEDADRDTERGDLKRQSAAGESALCPQPVRERARRRGIRGEVRARASKGGGALIRHAIPPPADPEGGFRRVGWHPLDCQGCLATPMRV